MFLLQLYCIKKLSKDAIMKKCLLLLLFLPKITFSESAIFAGGCFWCMQSDFDKVKGVAQTIAGYDGGSRPHPTYRLVSSGRTQYVESVKVIYNPKIVSYAALIQYFFHHIDPFDKRGQFCDKGRQYRSVIFYQNAAQKTVAEKTLKNIQAYFKNKTVYTEVLSSTQFYPAENYHQSYYKKNPLRYEFYRYTCGRDKRLKAIWH